MPTCLECQGKGQREIRKEVMVHCPTCEGTKKLSDGTVCEECNQWGEIGTGEFEVETQLCNVCWGSGHVSEGSLTQHFLIRAVPTTLIVLGGGGAAIWAAWNFTQSPLITSLVSIIVFGLWGAAMYTFIGLMPKMGEISPTNWFLIRAIPMSLVALGVGGPIIWLTWVFSASAALTGLFAFLVFAVWGVFMYFFISYMPE